MFRFIDFQNYSFIVTFLNPMFTFVKRFCRYVLIMYQRRFYDKGEIIWRKNYAHHKMKKIDFKW